MPNSAPNIKKKMLFLIIAVFLALLVLILLIRVLSEFTEKPSSGTSETTDKPYEIEFSDEYVTDSKIFNEDEVYFTYDRTIYFFNPQTGVTEGIEEGNFSAFGSGVEFLCNMIEAIKDGDCEAYNAFFSSIYFEENDEKPAFSMQKLYDILITEHSVTEEKNENGGTYKEYIYELRYKIRNNNGSFRSDVGSDATRAQYFLITNRGGRLQIDKLYSYGL